MRINSTQGMNHVAWSCDGKKLAAVGIDKIVRVWQPDKSMEMRSASLFSGAHSEEVDYVTWNPTHPELFCSSSQKDRRIVFWDARPGAESRHVQQCSLKTTPVQTNYSPDGKTLLYVSASHQLFFMAYGKHGEDGKETWASVERDNPMMASTAMFNFAGDGVILTHNSEHTIRITDYPSLTLRENPAAHVGGCVAAALDPRGRYLASGGHDSIVNMFDTTEWICARTITSCEHSITALSFSHDGEFLAISSTGNYIDICGTETGAPLHRVPALAPSPTVTWHPSKYVIAYCGQTKLRDGGPPPVAIVSLFGPGV
ncbi:WD40-repeat-containing domain protein [Amylostereum chailletii]|nr:WD40-repeat-containing domain protein [Amylostereum chailletii]